MTMAITPEQGVIFDAVRAGESVGISAFAGTGKTQTLEGLARRAWRDHRRVQYLSFNRANAQDAHQRFGQYAQAATAHKLAWEAYGSQFAPRLVQGAWPIVKALSDSPVLQRAVWPFPRDTHHHALAVVATLERFTQSAEDQVLPEHVPETFLFALAPAAASAYRTLVAQTAQTVWDRWPTEPQWPILHDWYLKGWALSHPALPADLILFDEAQDANPVLFALVEQQAAQKVYAGDPYQQLYAWRGAVNVIQNLPHRQLPLTCSWRFGTQIADLANTILQPLTPPYPVRGRKDRPSTFTPIPQAPVQLFRTNAGVLQATLRAVQAGQHPAVVGGIEPIVQLLQGLHRLRDGAPSFHSELAAFRTWRELQEADEAGLLGTLHPLVAWVDTHALTLTSTLTQLQASVTSQLRAADVVLTTVHKAKGLQWPTVQLGSDFLPFMQASAAGMPPQLQPEEVHCLYVAVTRAESHLDWHGIHSVLNTSWRQWRPTVAAPASPRLAPTPSP